MIDFLIVVQKILIQVVSLVIAFLVYKWWTKPRTIGVVKKPIYQGTIVTCPKCNNELFRVSDTFDGDSEFNPSHFDPLTSHILTSQSRAVSTCCDHRWFVAGKVHTKKGWIP